ncbi:ABC transporter ATP-binding protein [Streptantibioticus parmotrematis]|uniref:ABC transporter ATP-binding protein n=1 Tax=Streptantibioticus parmotrematis TaxID=2873249 RepID=UPI0033F33309
MSGASRSPGGRSGELARTTADRHPCGDLAVLEARGLGKRYRRRHALSDCSFRIPAGRVCGLVGPNGGGKSTLMELAAGLTRPTSGSITVFGEPPHTASARRRIAYLAQDKPLYSRFTIEETLRLGRELNPVWDQDNAERIVRQGELPLSARVGSLSRGERTRVALAVALAKRPELLLLDEPMADVDPISRHQLTGVLMAEAAEHGITVLISSHVLGELDGICDFVLLLGAGRARLAGDVDEILDRHRLLVGTDDAEDPLPEPDLHEVVEVRRTRRQVTALVRPRVPVADGWDVVEPAVEDVLMAYLRSPGATPLITSTARPVMTPHAER